MSNERDVAVGDHIHTVDHITWSSGTTERREMDGVVVEIKSDGLYLKDYLWVPFMDSVGPSDNYTWTREVFEILPPPAPPEPLAGSVVQDKDGDFWVRAFNTDKNDPWVLLNGFNEFDPEVHPWEWVVENYGPVTVKYDAGA